MYFRFKTKTVLRGLLWGEIVLVSVLGAIAFRGVWAEPALRMAAVHAPVREQEPTKLPSRRWMVHAITISKKEHLSPPRAARLHVYVASLYSDVVKKTGDTREASYAVSEFIRTLFPNYSAETEAVLITLGAQARSPTSEAATLLAKYKDREKSDGANLVWDQKTPAGNFWHARAAAVDDGAMAGAWQRWIVTGPVSLPSPPKRTGMRDALEMRKLLRALGERAEGDEATIFFWDGVDYSSSGPGENTTVAALWQNVLYAEVGRELDDASYAQRQKILAQGIADALIFTWKTKYAYFRERPSMRIPALNALVQDPPYPGFVSEHAAVSAVASGILTALVPEKKEMWTAQAKNASLARLLSGAEFESDVREGERLGAEVARAVLEKTFPGISITPMPAIHLCRNELCAGAELMLLALRDTLAKSLKTIFNKVSPGFNDEFKRSGLDNKWTLGAAWVDYDNDGNLDLVSNTALYRNTGDGTFRNVTSIAGLDNVRRGSVPSFFADYDNDGCQDLYIVGYGTWDSPGQLDSLYHNNCNGTFSDATESAGISDAYHGEGAAWADYNNDGFVDVYVASWGVTPYDGAQVFPYGFEPNLLYRNNGDGTFTNVAEIAGVEGFPRCDKLRRELGASYKRFFESRVKPAFQPIWFDYNNDEWPDLFVATDTFLSPLYRNNGDGTFADVTEEAGLCTLGTGMGVAVGDYDNDGDLDLYVTNTGKNYLWHNNGDGTFKEVAEEAGVADTGQGWGTGFFDYDNDGYLDLYVVNGGYVIDGSSNRPARYLPGVKQNDFDELFRNNGDGTFTALTKQAGISGNDAKKGAAFGDYNNDGFVDVYVTTFDPDLAEHRLYTNRTTRNHWLSVELAGTKSHRNAIGARITLKTGGLSQIREITAGDSFLSQSSFVQTFGLAKHTTADMLEVAWPSGIKTQLLNVAADQKITLTEGE